MARIKRRKTVSKRLYKKDRCNRERQFLSKISKLSLNEMLYELTDYVKHNKPCINISGNMNTRSSTVECDSLCPSDTICGDLNGDGILNILDVVILVNIILGDGVYNPCGDINGDCELNVLDIVALVNFVLGYTDYPAYCPRCNEVDTDDICDPCEDSTEITCLDSGCGVRMDKCFQCGGDLWTCGLCCSQWSGTSETECELHFCTEGQCSWNAWGGDICEGPGSF